MQLQAIAPATLLGVILANVTAAPATASPSTAAGLLNLGNSSFGLGSQSLLLVQQVLNQTASQRYVLACIGLLSVGHERAVRDGPGARMLASVAIE